MRALLLLLPLIALSAGQGCNLDIRLTADQLTKICPAPGPVLGLEDGPWTKLRAENQVLKEELGSMKKDYGKMVDTVNKMEKETASWREIVEWPVIEQVFKPDNETLYMVDPNGPTHTDCSKAVSRSGRQGIYNIQPEGAARAFLAFCDSEGWTILQRRFDGSETFYRPWDEYMQGFGQLSGEMWMGLENAHLLTSQSGLDYTLRTEVVGYNGKLYTLENPYFLVSSEIDDYTLYVGNMTSGNYKDVFGALDGTKFTALDDDNDNWPGGNCADYYRGGFWLSNCGFDLNREYCDGQGCMSLGRRAAKKSLLKLRPSGDAPPKSKPKPKKPKKPKQGRNRGGY